MSFQAYLDNIEEKTGKTPAELIKLAKEKGYDDPKTKPGTIITWLKEDFDLGRGHAMTIVYIIKNGDKAPENDVGGTNRNPTDKLKLDGKAK